MYVYAYECMYMHMNVCICIWMKLTAHIHTLTYTYIWFHTGVTDDFVHSVYASVSTVCKTLLFRLRLRLRLVYCETQPPGNCCLRVCFTGSKSLIYIYIYIYIYNLLFSSLIKKSNQCKLAETSCPLLYMYNTCVLIRKLCPRG